MLLEQGHSFERADAKDSVSFEVILASFTTQCHPRMGGCRCASSKLL